MAVPQLWRHWVPIDTILVLEPKLWKPRLHIYNIMVVVPQLWRHWVPIDNILVLEPQLWGQDSLFTIQLWWYLNYGGTGSPLTLDWCWDLNYEAKTPYIKKKIVAVPQLWRHWVPIDTILVLEPKLWKPRLHIYNIMVVVPQLWRHWVPIDNILVLEPQLWGQDSLFTIQLWWYLNYGGLGSPLTGDQPLRSTVGTVFSYSWGNMGIQWQTATKNKTQMQAS